MIYLDNGATSMPKPESVVRAVSRALRQMSSSGRGSSRAGAGADEMLFTLRRETAEMFSCEPKQVVLTTSATHGLNIAIKSLVKPGDRVVISGMEHNAVVRPLYGLGAKIEYARGKLFDEEALLEEFDEKLTKDTAACIMTHVSNVFGWILPVNEVAEMCRQRGIPFVLDASQSAGILPVSMDSCGFVAMPGHKGLLGPQGTGLLLCQHQTKPLMEGGTGSISKSLAMPDFLPDQLEPGTHNVPGYAGLLAGIRFVKSRGDIYAHEKAMGEYAASLLEKIPGVRVYTGKRQTGVVSFTVEGRDCVLLGEALSHRWDIALRAGLHCAPVAHETAGTLETGTIRISPGVFTRKNDIRFFAEKLEFELEKM